MLLAATLAILVLLTLIASMMVRPLPFTPMLPGATNMPPTPPADEPADPRCGACGYIVRGIESLRCPECGSDLRAVGIDVGRRRGRFTPPGPLAHWLTVVG